MGGEALWIWPAAFGKGFVSEIDLLNLYLKWKLVYEYVKDFKNEVSERMSTKNTHFKRGMTKSCAGVDWKKWLLRSMSTAAMSNPSPGFP